MLIEQIKNDQVAARKASDKLAATLLTTLLGEANMVAKNAQRATPTDEEVLAVVRKFLKGILETQTVLSKSGADESDARMQTVRAEQVTLERYLPKQLHEDELMAIVTNAIANGTSADMPGLMAFLKANHAGAYDGKLASSVIKAAIAA